MMTKDQAIPLAEFVHRMRPDWDTPGILANIGKVKQLNAWEVAHALLRLAENPKAESPGALATTGGEHWRERAREGGTVRRPPKKADECRTHPGQWATHCGPCATDKLAADVDEPLAKIPGATPTNAREELRKAQR